MNRLTREQSSYLRHASHQKIDWYPWSEEAFIAARRESKPVFLSSGAVWCHWCHVMASESFEDDEVAKLLNEGFINIKLDRDERPDIDRRFQQTVAAMGGGTGWPLNVFLTPDKKVFFGGTYFPPEDRQGSPGFKKILLSVSTFYKTKKDDAESYAASVMSTLLPEKSSPEEFNREMLNEAEKDMLSLFDEQNGGFGTFPKFPAPGAVEFLLRRFSEGGHRAAGNAARITLMGMARGGFHDQLGGGFHRYSVDEAWIVPHFEKMTDDNAGLLRNYVEGYALFGTERFREVAQGIISFIGEELSDPNGGFYASEDADVTPYDEGGYFSWTAAELKEALSPEEYEVVSHHLVHQRGGMHHDPMKSVLALNREPEEIAALIGKSTDQVAEMIKSAKTKLLMKRRGRTAPFIDRMIYTSLNGMMIASYFRAYMILGNAAIRDSALKALNRVLQERFLQGKLYHAAEVPALLDDYIHLIDALVAGYEATGEHRYLARAEELMALCRQKFLDSGDGGFFDTEEEVLGVRLKRIEDVPHPSANGVAIMVLLKLGFMTGKEGYRREAERSLRIFYGPARTMGVHAGTYFSALHAYFNWSTLTVEAAPDHALAQAARAASCRLYSSILYGANNSRVIPCMNGVCSAPIFQPAGLTDVVSSPRF